MHLLLLLLLLDILEKNKISKVPKRTKREGKSFLGKKKIRETENELELGKQFTVI